MSAAWAYLRERLRGLRRTPELRSFYRWQRENPTWLRDGFLAGMRQAGAAYYGDGGTIHHTGHLDVEVTPAGEVVAIWFRCRALPFEVAPAGERRADEMRRMYRDDPPPPLTGIEYRCE